MNALPRRLTLDQWAERYSELVHQGLRESFYGGPLHRHVQLEGDVRLKHLRFDNSAAALRLWNFLLTENRRLEQAREQGCRLVGTMKDLGTIPVIAFSFPQVRAFYPDGAWWTPCLMECSDGLLAEAERLGLDASFCPVRALVPAFLNEEHFPRPDLLICSTGSICDDFTAIAQRLEHLGHAICWWEIPRRRPPEESEAACLLPGGMTVPLAQVELVSGELARIGQLLAERTGQAVTAELLSSGIRKANEVRLALRELRRRVYGAAYPLLPGLEMLVAEMLAIHFCSDREEALAVLKELLKETRSRARSGSCQPGPEPVRVFWVNPVADLRLMNLLEDWGGRICGTDYMFTHALDPIPEDLPPYEALARVALADPMVGSTLDRARRIVADCRTSGAEALVVSRIPGASHCAWEGELILNLVARELEIPAVEIEVPPLCDSMLPTLAGRIEALVETARERRHPL